jgi:hypothetical protein
MTKESALKTQRDTFKRLRVVVEELIFELEKPDDKVDSTYLLKASIVAAQYAMNMASVASEKT